MSPLDTRSGQNELPLVDAAQFGAMRHALGAELDEVIGEFFANCETFSKRLGTLALAADAAGLREVCHEIRGAAGCLGLARIAGRATHWELLAMDGWTPAAEVVTGEFESLVAATRQALDDGR